MNEVNWLHQEDTTVASTGITDSKLGWIGLHAAKLGPPNDSGKISLMNKIHKLEEENRQLREENAELREKCMTNFERLQAAATVQDAANMIYDGLFPRVVNIDHAFILKWLKSRKSE